MKSRPPVLAHQRFLERADQLAGRPIGEVFSTIHATNLWGADESVSGLGSELAATAKLRAELPALLLDLGVKTLLDIPCGDFAWLSHAELPVERYIGADIVEAIVENNRARYGREFQHLDLCSSALPKADLVLCRDCLVHLSFEHIAAAVRNLKCSGAQWLLTTTFLECDTNADISTGDWRMLNFQLPPFNWGPPERILLEGCTEAAGGYSDKSLALWKLGTVSVIPISET